MRDNSDNDVDIDIYFELGTAEMSGSRASGVSFAVKKYTGTFVGNDANAHVLRNEIK